MRTRVSSYSAYVLETFVTLAGVCVLAALVLWGGRRFGLGRASGPIQLCGHLQLEARRAIYLVKVADQVYILGVAEGGFTKIGEIPAASVPPATPARAATFAEVLARVSGRGSKL